VRLLGEDHAKGVEATFQLVVQTAKDDDGRIAELKALWDRVKVSLPGEAVTYGIATSLGEQLHEKGKF
jgi:hypothetical protein